MAAAVGGKALAVDTCAKKVTARLTRTWTYGMQPIPIGSDQPRMLSAAEPSSSRATDNTSLPPRKSTVRVRR